MKRCLDDDTEILQIKHGTKQWKKINTGKVNSRGCSARWRQPLHPWVEWVAYVANPHRLRQFWWNSLPLWADTLEIWDCFRIEWPAWWGKTKTLLTSSVLYRRLHRYIKAVEIWISCQPPARKPCSLSAGLMVVLLTKKKDLVFWWKNVL